MTESAAIEPEPERGAAIGSTVLITWPDYPDDSSGHARRLMAADFRLRRAPKLGARSPEKLMELVRHCTAAIVSTDPFTAEVLAAAPHLGIISRVGVGTDSIDLAAAAARGISVTAAKGSNESAVAEHTIGLMLAALRKTVAQDTWLRAGEWRRTGDALGRDLGGKTVGLVGLGTTGMSVARLLSGFAVTVIGYDPVVTRADGVTVVSLPELLRTADVISLHCPLTPATANLIDAKAIAAMRRGMVLVNTARGGVVDEAALAEALRNGQVAAAGLDVFHDEPPQASALLALPDRTVLTPHIAGLTLESVEAMVDHATQAVLDWAAGRVPTGLVTRSSRKRLSTAYPHDQEHDREEKINER